MQGDLRGLFEGVIQTFLERLRQLMRNSSQDSR
jgi:hypothetical protein